MDDASGRCEHPAPQCCVSARLWRMDPLAAQKGSASPNARRHGAVEWAELAKVAAASGHTLRPCAVRVPPRLCHVRMRARATSIGIGQWRTWAESAKRINRRATATEYSLGCAPGMLGDLSDSARRALPPTNMLCGAFFIVHLRAQTLRACAFHFFAGAVGCCRSSLSPCRCPAPCSCQGVSVWASWHRPHAHKSGESAWHA